MTDLQQRLASRRQQHLFRQRQIISSPQGVVIQTANDTLLSFCSNDYLGLANDPRVKTALKMGADNYGVGAGASHLISGHSFAHHELEKELADFVGTPRALLFSSGYMANLAVAATLLGRRDVIFEDKLNHASLIDGARISGADIKRFRHGDMDQLNQLLEATDTSTEKMILSDGVFSMDGDLAPLAPLNELARSFNAWLLIDDAHGLGIIGNTGRGSFEISGVRITERTLLVGTLGKGFGTFGAFVAGGSDLIELLIQEARTYIYTTAIPPAIAEATRESLRIIKQEPERRDHLQTLIHQFREGARSLGLELMESGTPIQPLLLGEAQKAMAASEYLRSKGILVSAIRPPTVPVGKARLRITFSALHQSQHVEQLLEALSGLPER